MARPHVLTLSLRRRPDGWAVVTSDGRTRSVEGHVSADAFEGIPRGEVASRMGVAGRDQHITEEEATRGRALLAALQQAGEAYGSLCRWAGRESTGVLVLDVDPELATLPWSAMPLTAGGLPLEVDATAVLAFLGSGSASELPEGHAATVWWSPTPDEPSCAEVISNLHQIAIPLAEAGPGPLILHIVQHGEDDGWLRDAEHDVSADSVGARLFPRLRDARLVVLSVCHGGGDIDVLGGRLLALGAHAVLAPTAAASTQACMRIVRGVHEALPNGPLYESIREARRGLRAWGHPLPEHRWGLWRWWVGSIDAAQQGRVVTPSWHAPHWPRGTTDTVSLLDRAHDCARIDGYLGLAHLAAVLHIRIHSRTSSRLVPVPDVPFTVTPRVESLISGLPERWTPEVLRGRVRMALGILGGDGFETVDSELEAHREPASRFVVTGGPEDGRVMHLAPGAILGRFAPSSDANHQLYANTPWTDPKLSRQAALLVRPGLLTIRRRMQVERSGTVRVEGPGDVEVYTGDVLHLTSATTLVAL